MCDPTTQVTNYCLEQPTAQHNSETLVGKEIGKDPSDCKNNQHEINRPGVCHKCAVSREVASQAGEAHTCPEPLPRPAEPSTPSLGCREHPPRAGLGSPSGRAVRAESREAAVNQVPAHQELRQSCHFHYEKHKIEEAKCTIVGDTTK